CARNGYYGSPFDYW
nr:immunoglobulin heavy chain junction region [Mus musculus]